MKKTIKNIFSQAPIYILWILISTILWSWVFTFVTDTSRDKKVTVFIDAPAVFDTALAARLEENMPSELKMIKVHPFSYAMFDSSEILNADIYIVKGSDAETYIEDFVPIDGGGDYEYYVYDGKIYGIKVYDASTGVGSAAEYISYESAENTGEDFYLFFGKRSVHLGRGNDSFDDYAFVVADILINLD